MSDRKEAEKYKNILQNIKNDIECMMCNEDPSLAEMWWNLALGAVLRRLKQYMEE